MSLDLQQVAQQLPTGMVSPGNLAAPTEASTITLTSTLNKVLSSAGQWVDVEWWAANSVWLETASGSL
jgi:hypothetical protein